MSLKITFHFFRALYGFLAASLVSAVLCYAFCGLLTLSYVPVILDDIDARNFNAETVFAFIGTVFLTICVLGIPLWILSVLVCEFCNIESKIVPISAGIGTVALILFDTDLTPFQFIYEGSRVYASTQTELLFWLAAVIIGAVGGLTYWAIAGRHSGTWKSAQ